METGRRSYINTENLGLIPNSDAGVSQKNNSSNVTKQDAIYLEIGGNPIHPETKSLMTGGGSDSGASFSGRESHSRSKSKNSNRRRVRSRSSNKASDVQMASHQERGEDNQSQDGSLPTQNMKGKF